MVFISTKFIKPIDAFLKYKCFTLNKFKINKTNYFTKVLKKFNINVHSEYRLTLILFLIK